MYEIAKKKEQIFPEKRKRKELTQKDITFVR